MMRMVLSGMLFVGAFALPAASAETWTVLQAEGESAVRHSGEKGWLRLKSGDLLEKGARVVCSEGGLVQLESQSGVLELSNGADLSIQPEKLSETISGESLLELASGQIKGDWSSEAQNRLAVWVPGGKFQVQQGFFSLWIYTLLGQPYTRVDVFRGEAFVHETSEEVPLALMAGQSMTLGMADQAGPRAAPSIEGFDQFEIEVSRIPQTTPRLTQKTKSVAVSAA